jgi:hypothetical protein
VPSAIGTGLGPVPVDDGKVGVAAGRPRPILTSTLARAGRVELEPPSIESGFDDA